MTCKVRYLREDAIELDANDLLGEYSLARGVPVAAPIPVEHLLEFHLGLSLDFDNLHERLGIPLTGDEPDVLGALWVDSRAVFVDQSLDPEDRPWLEGRYRYTLGHEVGHWQLHRDQLGASAGQGSLFSREPEPTIVCRKSQAKERGGPRRPADALGSPRATCTTSPRRELTRVFALFKLICCPRASTPPPRSPTGQPAEI